MKNAYRLVIICVLLLTTVGMMVTAQSAELLTNPGFEPPFVPLDGDVLSDIAEGWSPWHVPTPEGLSPSDNAMPEYFAASDTVNGLTLTPRIHGGEDAQQYFSYYATHTGGLYQEVTGVTAGDPLTFSVYANLWASDASETSDGSGEILFSVGIDPNGGTDGESADIVWSEPASVYDAWNQYTVAAVAAADSVTVFIRSTATAKIANNVVYVDDASLTSGAAAPMETEAAPPVIEVTEAAPAETEAAPVVEVTEAAPAETEAAPVVEATEAAPAETEAAPVIEVTEAAPAETEAAPVVEVTEAAPAETEAAPVIEVTEAAPAETEAAPVVEVTETAATEVVETPTLVPSPTLDTMRFPQSFEYTVQSGDTVVDLATRYGSSIDAIIIANGLNANAFISVGQVLIIPVAALPQPTLPPTLVQPTPVPTEVMPVQPPPPAEPVTYVIQYGDTLSGIAARFGTTARELARLNGITNPELIYYGQLIIISMGSPTPFPTSVMPPPTPVPTAVVTQTYRVMPGDTLYVISLRFGVPVYRLIEANNLANPNRIFVGQVLVIPMP